jgi:hypothetical protein
MADIVDEIMLGYARRTGLEPATIPSKRYLWTDAFAVCNWLGRFEEKGDEPALRFALSLVDKTHRVLGRHRPDDSRRGWLSGLDAEEGARHPTLGGLRIGKALPERPADEPYDPIREWDRDGQYFHYLTKWMHALACVSRVTRDPKYRQWAIELARAVFARFRVGDSSGSPVGLYWKMSIDLSRPLVPSMGQHDPLDAFITYSRLRAGDAPGEHHDLEPELRDLAKMCIDRNWFTDDALGVGGLLTDAHALARLNAAQVSRESNDLLRAILEAAAAGVETVLHTGALDAPPDRRLAFRELGLSIGLRAIPDLIACIRESGLLTGRDACRRPLEILARYPDLAARIEAFWMEPSNRRDGHWSEHEDINDVMLATSLAPKGYLQA